MSERFRERVDDVKCDLLDAFKTLAQIDNSGTQMEADKRRQIQQISSLVVQSLVKQSKNKNAKVKIAVQSCLAALSNTLGGEMDQHFADVLPVIQATVEDSNFDALLDSLRILRTLFRSFQAGSQMNFLKETQTIQKILLSSLNHDYSRVVGTALSVTGSFVNTLLNKDGTFNASFKPLVPSLYDCVLAKLNKHDIDQEVKQLAIIASADLVSCCHTVLSADQITKIVQVFVSRLTHELTRETALKGLTLISLNETSDSRGRPGPRQPSKQVVNLSGLDQHLPALLDLLNKSQR